MSGIHQFVPMLHVGDAVGQHTVAVRDILVARGIGSEIYVDLDDPETAEQTRPASSYPSRAQVGDVLVYQLATASELAERLAGRTERLVVNYHNITPPPLFAPWDDGLARHQVQAHAELRRLAARAVLGVAVSELNRGDLVDADFAATAVVPPVVQLPAEGGPSAANSERAARRQGAKWLAVGRLAPNKAIEDTVAALLAYRLRHDPAAELLVIGKPALPGYAAALRRYVADLGLIDAVHFVGRVSDAVLTAAYADADVLVVSSEHEGFCLPVVEAMAHGLPVVAFREGALPEVLGDGGVLLYSKDPLAVADAVRRLQTDDPWRAQRVAAGRAHLPSLGLATAGERLVDLLMAVRDGAPWSEEVTVRAANDSSTSLTPGTASA